MRDRPPIFAVLLLFTAMLTVALALAAVGESVAQAEQPPPEVRSESQSHPTQTDRQGKAT